jgi:hypothetical protein
MKNNFLVVLLLILITSCSSDSVNEPEIIAKPVAEETTNEEVPENLQGTQIFQIEFSELKRNTEPQGKDLNLEPAFVLISMIDASENEIYNRERFELFENEGKFETEEIVLNVGTYKITEFIILDANDVVISLIPQEESALALFTDTTLPLEFSVLEKQINILPTNNIETTGLNAIDFGYGELNFNFPEDADFFSITIDETQELTPKFLTLESITGAVFIVDWGDGTIEEYVSNVTDSGFENAISHSYSENAEYIINVSGAIASIELLNFTSNQESNWKNHITSIDLEKLILLKHCTIHSGDLTTIDLSSNINLEFLYLGYNKIIILDVTNNSLLKTLNMRHNQISTLDLSNNTELITLSLPNNEITTLDLTNNINLKLLDVRGNQLSSLDISKNIALTNLDCIANMLNTIDVSQNIDISFLAVGENNLTNIDISKNLKIKRLDLFYNQLSTIDLSSNPNLETFYIQGNLLSTIDLSANPKLERLIIEDNNFSSLNLSSVPKIFDLEIGGNQFDAQTLDMLIDHINLQATSNDISNGYMDFQNNPGSDNISNASLVKINQLISSYNWFFNNN